MFDFLGLMTKIEHDIVKISNGASTVINGVKKWFLTLKWFNKKCLFFYTIALVHASHSKSDCTYVCGWSNNTR